MTAAPTTQAEPLASAAEALGIRLSDAQTRQFELYHAELVRWNKRVNLTAITEWQSTQSRHFLDSLSVALALPQKLRRSSAFIDIGSGGGFPGIPLKLAFPGMHGTLIDATAKKTAFLSHICETLNLHNMSVRTGRAETLAHDGELRQAFDIALARAVAQIAALAELTLPFARIGGLVVMHKKSDIADELERARSAIETLGGRLREVLPISIPGLADDRTLVILEKVHPTPQKYPRRPGIPAKSPIAITTRPKHTQRRDNEQKTRKAPTDMNSNQLATNN